MKKKKFTDQVLDRLFTEMVRKDCIKVFPTGSVEKGELIGLSAAAVNIHRTRETLPYAKIVGVCMENDLDLNLVFKGEKDESR